MAGFQDTPNEIAAHIFSFLPIRHNKKVSLTCKRFHMLVEPILYSTFMSSRRFSMPLFIRTLLEKPHIRLHLKTIYIWDAERILTRPGDYLFQPEMGEIGRILQDRFVGAIAGLSNSLRGLAETWFTEEHLLYDFGPLAIFLIIYSGSLQRIQIVDINVKSTLAIPIFCLVSQQQHSTNILRSLKEIKLSSKRKGLDEITLGEISKILAMPSLRRFEAEMMSGLMSPILENENESLVQHLSLKWCSFPPTFVEPLLLNLKHLQYLTITPPSGSLDHGPGSSKAILPRFLDSINHLQGCLEELWIHDYEATISGSRLQLSLLKPFHKLRSLKLSSPFQSFKEREISIEDCNALYDFSTLPSSLEVLSFTGGLIQKHLEHNIRNLPLSITLPGLKIINVDYLLQEEMESASKVPTLYNEHGIVIQFVHSW